MNFYKQASDFGFSSIDFLIFGFQRGWVTREDIVHQAIEDFDTKDKFENLPDIAFSNNLDEIDFRNLLMTYLKNKESKWTEERKKIIEDQWRLVLLSDLNNNQNSDEDKIKKLQELYAEFDYPQDMIGCSIYSTEKIDPLVALRNLLDDLKKITLHDAYILYKKN